MMKTLMIVVALLLPSLSQAAYFRILKPLDEIKSGVFVKIGTPNDNVLYGLQTTIIKHKAEDGFLLLPGVSWNLLDIGGAKTPTGSLSAVIGPSVDLSEPIKALLLSAVQRASPDGLGAIKAMLVPAVDGKACIAASMGPGLGLDLGSLSDLKKAQGALVIHAGLSAKW